MQNKNLQIASLFLTRSDSEICNSSDSTNNTLFYKQINLM